MTQVASRPQPTSRLANRPQRSNRTLRLYVVDVAIAALFLLVLNVPLTGLVWHEWLGIAVGVGSAVHLIQHTDWVRNTAERIRSTSLKNQVNGIMTVLLFVAYGTIIASGLVISEVALPWLGVNTSGSADFWLWLHLSSVTATIWLTALHIALNWKWIGTTTTRYVVKPLRRLVAMERS